MKSIVVKTLYWLLSPSDLDRSQISAQAVLAQDIPLAKILHHEYRWRKVRNEHIQREGACQMCRSKKELEVHHCRPWHLFSELRFDPANLLTLCHACHFRFGHFLNWKNWNPGIREMVGWVQGFMHEVLTTKETA